MRRDRFVRSMALVLALLVTACGVGPRALHYGQEECAHCRMIIGDARYAAQLVTAKGASRAFDDTACLLAFLRHNAEAADGVRGVWLADFDQEGGWVDADAAWLVRAAALRTPMSGGLAAHASEAAAHALARDVGGTVMRWADVRADDATGSDDHARD
jgi:copper chaperone NosL